jgi:hypothetical protein
MVDAIIEWIFILYRSKILIIAVNTYENRRKLSKESIVKHI